MCIYLSLILGYFVLIIGYVGYFYGYFILIVDKVEIAFNTGIELKSILFLIYLDS